MRTRLSVMSPVLVLLCDGSSSLFIRTVSECVCSSGLPTKLHHPGKPCEPTKPFPTLLLSISHIVAHATRITSPSRLVRSSPEGSMFIDTGDLMPFC